MTRVTMTLSRFRSYDTYQAVSEKPFLLIVGKNGAGKTNFLEAASLFAPGRGLRGIRTEELQQAGESTPFSVFMHLVSDTGPLMLKASPKAGFRGRMYAVNDVPLASHALLLEWLKIIWITPEMDTLFLGGKTVRRKFFDRIVFTLYPEHATALLKYEKAMRERQRLLEDDHYSVAWCIALETVMAEAAHDVTCFRSRARQALAEVESLTPGFPRTRIELREEGDPDVLKTLLAKNREKDRIIGSASVGPHKTHILVFHPNGREAALCSTGEQKALLVSMVLALARLMKQHAPGCFHLLLLDELAAHFDAYKKDLFLSELSDIGMRVWISATDEAPFANLRASADVLAL